MNNLSVVLYLVVIFVSFLLGIFGSFKVGLGWDSWQENTDYLNLALVNQSMSLQEAYDNTRFTFEFYGILQYQLVDFFMEKLGFGEFQANSALTYLIQNLFNYFLSFLSVSALSFSIFRYFDLKTAIMYLALISSTSIWLGQSLMNYKDVPVMAGMAFVSSGISLIYLSKRKKLDYFFALTFISFGSIISIGSRPGSLPLILLLAVTASLTIGFLNKLKTSKIVTYTIAIISLSVLLPMTVLHITNPFGQIDIKQWVSDSVLTASNYHFWAGTTLTIGREIQSQVPFWYPWAWIYAQTSLLILVLLLLSSIFFTYLFIWKYKDFSSKSINDWTLPILAFVQAILIPILLVIYGVKLYNGIRQFIFVIPSLMTFIPLFLYLNERQKVMDIKILKFIFGLALSANLMQLIYWFPYNYSYLNEFESSYKPNIRWELDYWGVSSREGVNKLLSEFKVSANVAGEGNYTIVPFVSEETDSAKQDKEIGIYYSLRNQEFLPSNCRKVFEIKRLKAILGKGYLCPKL